MQSIKELIRTKLEFLVQMMFSGILHSPDHQDADGRKTYVNCVIFLFFF